MLGRTLRKGMPVGVRIGRHIPGGTVGLDVVSTDEGLHKFRSALQRLRATPPTIDNPVFGKLTHEQWIQLNLRHAELHHRFHTDAEASPNVTLA